MSDTGNVPSRTSVTIGELSELTGLSVSAIRFYQRRGVLPARTEGGWQRFAPEVVDRLAVVTLAKRAGWSLDEVIRILDALDADPDSVPAQAPTWAGLAAVKLDEVEARLRELQDLQDLLTGALRLGYVPPERAAAVTVTLGWAPAPAPGEAPAPQQGSVLPAIVTQQG